MKKKIFYFVRKELQSVGDIEETTGYKTVTLYNIVDDKPELIDILDLENSANSEEEIQEYLDDNGFGDETFELIEL
jgi:hypothetical protein